MRLDTASDNSTAIVVALWLIRTDKTTPSIHDNRSDPGHLEVDTGLKASLPAIACISWSQTWACCALDKSVLGSSPSPKHGLQLAPRIGAKEFAKSANG
jgi:hypothetical protein